MNLIAHTAAVSNFNQKADAIREFIILNYDRIIEQTDKSPATKKKYKTDSRLFVEWLEDNTININAFRQYKEYLRGITNMTTKTKKNKQVSAGVVLKELYQNYRILEIDITAGVKYFSVSSDHVKDGLSHDDIKKLKAYIGDVLDQDRKSRLYAMFYLLAFQGLRQFEMTALRVDDFRPGDNVIMVKGKGRDDKEQIDLHPTTTAALKTYLETFDIKSGYIFQSLSNNMKGKDSAISTRGVRDLWKSIFKTCNIDNSVHGFRHYFVTNLLEVTKGDILTVSKFSRHKSLQAVKLYDDRQKKKEMLPMYYKAFEF